MMRKFMFLSIILFPFLLEASHVFIWNYDQYDTFYDSEIGTTINCIYWLEQILTAEGHTYDTGNSLPTNLNNYDVVFVSTGWWRC